MNGYADENKIKCPFLTCLAGAGVAGNGCCFLNGNPELSKCNKKKLRRR